MPYVDLFDLANEWARETGELPAIIMRRIIDWAEHGSFPQRAFLNVETGDEVTPQELGDLYACYTGRPRDGRPGTQSSLKLSLTAMVHPAPHSETYLSVVAVDMESLAAFCDGIEVQPPSFILDKRARVVGALRDRARVPPEAPPKAPADRQAVEDEKPPDQRSRDKQFVEHSKIAKLRNRLKRWIEKTAGEVDPERFTKEKFLDMARQEFPQAISEYLFLEVWRKADIPEGFRRRGRRVK